MLFWQCRKRAIERKRNDSDSNTLKFVSSTFYTNETATSVASATATATFPLYSIDYVSKANNFVFVEPTKAIKEKQKNSQRKILHGKTKWEKKIEKKKQQENVGERNSCNKLRYIIIWKANSHMPHHFIANWIWIVASGLSLNFPLLPRTIAKCWIPIAHALYVQCYIEFLRLTHQKKNKCNALTMVSWEKREKKNPATMMPS